MGKHLCALRNPDSAAAATKLSSCGARRSVRKALHSKARMNTFMELDRFSAFRSSFTSTPARRDILRALAGIGLGLGVMQLSETAEARNKKKKNKKNKRNKPNQPQRPRPPRDPQPTPPPPTCTPQCGGKICGDDGCGGTCGSCPGVQDVCQNG